MNLRDLKLRLRAVFSPNRVERELDEELSFHIEREARRLIDDGMSPEEARMQAQARFGSITVAADECRDQRGVGFIDTTTRDVIYALRIIARAPLVSATIVVTVGLGLGLVTVWFTVLNLFLFRVDAVPDIHEMFAVERPRLENDERPRFTHPQFEAMQRETHVFSGMYAELADIDTRVDGQLMAITLVSGNAFQVLGVHAAMGRTLLPSDDDRAAPQPVVVLSDKGWERRFKRDPNVVGRSIIVGGSPYEIVGVMPKEFRGLSVGAPDLWAPLTSLAAFRPIHRGREERVGIDIVGRLRPGITPENARAQLDAWYAGSTGIIERGASTVALAPRRGTVPQPLEALIVFAPLLFAFGLILMIACANVANLMLARGVSRHKEIGIRLSLGAPRRRIIRQWLTECLLLALGGAAVGFFVSRLAIEGTIAAVLANFPPDLGDISLRMPGADWRVALFLVFAAVIATGLFGLMPALQATRIDPVRTLRGELIRDARPGRFRSILIGLQVAASALLLICSAVFLRSAFASTSVDPGLRTADTLVIEITNETKRAAMIEAIARDTAIVSFAPTWPDLMNRPRAAVAQSPGVKARVGYKMAGPEYFDVLGIPILHGRNFAAHERTSAAAVIILSETTAARLFPNGNAIGQVLQLDPDQSTRLPDDLELESRTFTVIGIARDVAGFRIADFKEADVYVPTNATMAKTGIVARIHGEPLLARQQLLDRLTPVDPNMGQVWTMQTIARAETYLLATGFWATLVLGSLALVLTVSGLFSVLSYLVEQRTKEIGVRMALGATARNVTRLVISQTARPVIVGLIAGTALALALATTLLSIAGAGMIGNVIHVLDPIAYATSLLIIIAACALAASIPAARASRVDPMKTLRQE